MPDEKSPADAEMWAEINQQLDADIEAWKQAIREHLDKSEAAKSRSAPAIDALAAADSVEAQQLFARYSIDTSSLRRRPLARAGRATSRSTTWPPAGRCSPSDSPVSTRMH